MRRGTCSKDTKCRCCKAPALAKKLDCEDCLLDSARRREIATAKSAGKAFIPLTRKDFLAWFWSTGRDDCGWCGERFSDENRPTPYFDEMCRPSAVVCSKCRNLTYAGVGRLRRVLDGMMGGKATELSDDLVAKLVKWISHVDDKKRTVAERLRAFSSSQEEFDLLYARFRMRYDETCRE
jgi:hypothetical protein